MRSAISGAASLLRSARIRAGEMQRRFQQPEARAQERPEPMVWTAAALLPGQSSMDMTAQIWKAVLEMELLISGKRQM